VKSGAVVMFNSADINLLAGFEQLPNSLTSKAFTADKIEFLSEISKRLLTHKDRPNVVALAYWLRKSNVASIEREYTAKQKGAAKLEPAGLVFQIAPGNVDALFAYYWSLSMLQGNTTVTRLSAERGEDAELILNCLQTVLDEERFSSIKGQSSFVYYDHEKTEYTQTLSLQCDRRVIWGGNKTIERIQRYPLKSSGKDIVFPDRQSIAVVRYDTTWTDEIKDRLSKALKTDITSLGQGACAAPLAIVWLGKVAEISAFLEREWAKIEPRFGFDQVNSLVFLHQSCALGGKRISASSVILENNTPILSTHTRSGLWHFIYQNIEDLDVESFSGIQTIGVFNIDNIEYKNLEEFRSACFGKHLTRLGRMLNFNVQWDGIDSLSALSVSYFTRPKWLQTAK